MFNKSDPFHLHWQFGFPGRSNHQSPSMLKYSCVHKYIYQYCLLLSNIYLEFHNSYLYMFYKFGGYALAYLTNIYISVFQSDIFICFLNLVAMHYHILPIFIHLYFNLISSIMYYMIFTYSCAL